MFFSILLSGLLTASTFASPIEIPAALQPKSLQPRGDRKFCDAEVVNADPPNEYCYQFCDLGVTRRVAKKPIVVSMDSVCTDPPEGSGCPVTVLNQATVEVSSTETEGTTDTTTVNAGFSFFGATLGASFAHSIESSHATTKGTTTAKASTNFLYIPEGKGGHVVFFPFYEEHCGPSIAIHKGNINDEKEVDCNPDYNVMIKHEADMDRIRGMQYNWDGVDAGDIFNYKEDSCVRLPMTDVNGSARGQYQVCDDDNTDNRCTECWKCDPYA